VATASVVVEAMTTERAAREQERPNRGIDLVEQRVRLTPGQRRIVVAATLCVLAILALPAVAHAEVWMSQYPAGTINAQPAVVSADVFGAAALDARTTVMTVGGVTQKTFVTQGSASGHWTSVDTLVDGTWKTTWTWSADTGGGAKATLYCYPGTLSNGAKAVTATVKDVTGATLTTSWSFTVGAAPTFGTPTPAAGSKVSTLTPTISIPVSDNTGVATVGAKVNGKTATAALVSGKAAITGFNLNDNAVNTVVVTATNTGSGSATRTWSFTVFATAGKTCVTCHGTSYNTDPAMGSDCTKCHYGAFAPPHGLTGTHTDASGTQSSGCTSCHGTDLVTVHQTTGCTCHNSASPTIKAVIAAGNAECVDCHSGDDAAHTDVAPAHEASPAPQSISIAGVSYGTHQCSECHSPTNLLDIHGSACGSCHPTPGNALVGSWNKGCVQGGCHTAGSGFEMHASINANHAFPADKTACLAAGCHDAGTTTPFVGVSIAQMHSNASTTTAGVTRSSCQICHAPGMTPTADCTSSGCHPDRAEFHGYLPATHTSTATTATITILGTAYKNVACVDCHPLELGPLHMPPATCKTCHDSLVPVPGGWNKGCVQAGCHPVGSSLQMHSDLDTPHERPAQPDTCFAPGCHATTNSVTVIHQNKQGCATCHGSGKTPTAQCTASGCHPDLLNPHAGQQSMHTSSGGGNYVTAGLDNGEHTPPTPYGYDAACSDCHVTDIIALHVNNCAACHDPSAPAAVRYAVANGITDCTQCHPGQHSDGINSDHTAMYQAYGCDCHTVDPYTDATQIDCSGCHTPATPSPNPATTSDASASYIGDAVVTLTPSDGVGGSFGIKATYHVVDGSAPATGTSITIPAPASGTVNHTLKYWSTDWTGNTETTKTVTFNVTHDSIPPITTSNIVPGTTYGGARTFTLTPTDANSSVAGTWWKLDSSTPSGWTSGTSVPVAAPARGTAPHTLYFYSRDSAGNTEVTKSVAFTIAAGVDFAFTGADQTFTVPSGITTVGVTLYGGAGGAADGLGLGGRGGQATAVVPVAAGQTLTVRVGGAGVTTYISSDHGLGGWPNGGSGYTRGGGGGGSTTVWRGSSDLVEAGGGGGGGWDYAIGAGGNGGAQGTSGGGYRTGGTATLAGAGGGGGGWNAGAAGSTTFRGGNGGTSYIASGSGALTAGVQAGNGMVMIRY
jgi:hypothetical protein